MAKYVRLEIDSWQGEKDDLFIVKDEDKYGYKVARADGKSVLTLGIELNELYMSKFRAKETDYNTSLFDKIRFWWNRARGVVWQDHQ